MNEKKVMASCSGLLAAKKPAAPSLNPNAALTAFL